MIVPQNIFFSKELYSFCWIIYHFHIYICYDVYSYNFLLQYFIINHIFENYNKIYILYQ